MYEVRTNRARDRKSRDGQFFPEVERIIKRFFHERFDAVVVSIGPGMFTSLRIGLSLAKSLTYVYDLPLVTVNTLDIIGVPLSLLRSPVLAAINAYHRELYVALYQDGVRITGYELMEVKKAACLLPQVTVVAGSGGIELQNVVKKGKGAEIEFVRDECWQPSAAKAAAIALPRIEEKKFDDPTTLEPFYLKRTDAERNYDKIHAK